MLLNIAQFRILKKISSSPVIRNSFVYVFCDGINKAIPFLLLPFITHYLTPSDYGVVTNYNVLVQIVSVFGYLCTAGALPVMFARLDKSEIKKYVSNMILLNTIVNIICVLFMLPLHGVIENSLNISFVYQVSVLVLVWFAGITNVNMLLWRCEEKPLAFGIYQISQSALNALSTILFVIVFLLGWQGRIYSMISVTVVFGLISVFVLYKRGYIEWNIDKTYLKQTLFFALPIIPHALSFWFKSGVDKIYLTKMCSLADNGYYSVALTWGAIVTMFLVSFNNAYAPSLYKKLAAFDLDKVKTIKEQVRLVKFIWISLAVTFFFVIGCYLVSVLLIQVMYPSSYFDSLYFLPWVMLGQFFSGCYLMFVGFAHYTFRTKGLGAITFSLSIGQVGLTYLLILKMGAIGSAVSAAIISAITFVFVAWYAMRVYRLPWFNFKAM